MSEERKRALIKMFSTLSDWHKQMVLYYLLGWCEKDGHFWQGLQEAVLGEKKLERLLREEN